MDWDRERWTDRGADRERSQKDGKSEETQGKRKDGERLRNRKR